MLNAFTLFRLALMKYLFSSLFCFLMLSIHGVEAYGQYLNEFRTIDGFNNNLEHPTWGTTAIPLLRFTKNAYTDGREQPAGDHSLSPRTISNRCLLQDEDLINKNGVSDFFWQWGQFLDHDIDLTLSANPQESYDIKVPTGDAFFDPYHLGNQLIFLDRSNYIYVNNIREQLNNITAFIDGSNVYGSNQERANELRAFRGSGKLKVGPTNLLPYNINHFPNAPDSEDSSFFLAGDIRANEQVGLTSLHILFVREHNLWAGWFKRIFPFLEGETIYQLARSLVTAEIQCITYNEFLPILLGPKALPPYKGYNPNINPGIANEFSTAAFRFGHSMLPTKLLRLDHRNQPITSGHLALTDAFFNPSKLLNNDGIEPILRGLCSQTAQDIDLKIVGDIRNFLFGPPGSGGFDLGALNIQRGRDHGLANYNQVRIDYGLPPLHHFNEVCADRTTQELLSTIYSSINDIDLWIGGLAEDHNPGALVGPTFGSIIKDQFERLRDGDRFWYESHLPPLLIRCVKHRTLSRIIADNTLIEPHQIQHNVFIVPTYKIHSKHKHRLRHRTGFKSRKRHK